MTPYDSDSSAGEEEEYTETNVLLGYASKEPGDDDATSRLGGRPEWPGSESPPSAALARCKICRDLMALLLQLNGELPDRFPGHERRLYVFACRRKSCRRREGSLRVLRGVRVAPGSSQTKDAAQKKNVERREASREPPKTSSNLGETLFGSKAMGAGHNGGSKNPFATTSLSNGGGSSNPFASPGNPFSNPQTPPVPSTTIEPGAEASDIKTLPKTFAETLSLNKDEPNLRTSPHAPATPPQPHEPWPPESEQPRPYPISYLSDAEFETLDPTRTAIPTTSSQNTDKMDADDTNTNDVSRKGSNANKKDREDRDVFESSMDRTFQKFADRLAQNPEQSIRYEFGGQPLLYSRTDAVGQLLFSSQPTAETIGRGVTLQGGGSGKGMPRCANCSSSRCFEVQLVPQAIAELEAGEVSLDDGMDWGTVIVGVCERNCQVKGVDEGHVGYLEEWVGVQWEEVASASASAGAGRR